METICPLMHVHWASPDHSRVLHGCFTGASRVFHGSLTVQNQFFGSLTQFFVSLTRWSHGWFTGGSRVVHGWFTGGSRVVPGWFTGGSRVVHGWFKGVSRLVSGCWRDVRGLWAAVKGDCKQWNWYKIDTKSPGTQPVGRMICSDLSIKRICPLHQRSFGKN